MTAQTVTSAGPSTGSARTYDVRTHGCQMNVHDSERLSGLLETAGYVDLASLPASERPAVADVVVFNTCAVRENADNKLYGNLGQLRPAKLANPDMQIAVGGCMAQKDRGTIVETGTHAQLVDTGGIYSQLWARQSGGFIDADQSEEAAE